MDFQGYLIKFGNSTFPLSLMDLGGWSAIPNRRLDAEAERDLDMELHRETSPNYKTNITIKTLPMNLAEKIAMQAVINDGMVDEVERRISCTYWNDETNEYVTAEFYFPDITYTIREVTANNIEYDHITITMIQY